MDIPDINSLRGNFVLLVGPMNSGKTEKAIRWAENLKYHTDCNVIFFKPDIDVRSPKDYVISNRSSGKIEFPATTIPSQNPEAALEIVKGSEKFIDAVFFDELNFFSKKIIQVIEELRIESGGKRLVVGTGLDKNFRGEPFEPVDRLISIADQVEFHKAYCKHIVREGNSFSQCKRLASYTMRLVLSPYENSEKYDFFDKNNEPVLGVYSPAKYYDPTIVVEKNNVKGIPSVYYISVCRECLKIPGKKETVEIYEHIRANGGRTLEQIINNFPKHEPEKIVEFLKSENRIYEKEGILMPTEYEYDARLGTYLPRRV